MTFLVCSFLFQENMLFPDLRLLVNSLNRTGETWNNVTHRDGWPSFGLRFSEETDERVVLEKLIRASNEPQFSGKFQVYATDSYAGGRYLRHDPSDLKDINYSRIGDVEEATAMPPRYHFSATERIAPIWVVPKLGYALTSKKLGENGMSIGVSHPLRHRSVR